MSKLEMLAGSISVPKTWPDRSKLENGMEKFCQSEVLSKLAW